MEKTSKTISNAPTFMYKENVKDVQYASTVQRHRYLLWVARVHVGLQTAADRAPHPHQRAISSPHCPHCPEACVNRIPVVAKESCVRQVHL